MHNVIIRVELLIDNSEIFYKKCVYIIAFVCVVCFSPYCRFGIFILIYWKIEIIIKRM